MWAPHLAYDPKGDVARVTSSSTVTSWLSSQSPAQRPGVIEGVVDEILVGVDERIGVIVAELVRVAVGPSAKRLDGP